MPNYKRARVPGGTYFFTVVTYGRRPFLCDLPARPLLGSILRRCIVRWPMTVNAMVLLPDHLHAIWTLPSADCDYSTRWAWIKKEFTSKFLEIGGPQGNVSVGKQRQRRRGVWQPRFWEHTIETDEDFEAHFDYIHFNPVKHGLVKCPRDWRWTTFHRWVDAGVYPLDWACSENRKSSLDFGDIATTVGE